MSSSSAIRSSDLEAFLADYHGAPIAELAPLDGGYWSSAFSYRVDDEALVLRLSELAEGFEIDQKAHRFASADLPVPRVRDVGEAFGQHFAISERHYGRHLETAPAAQASTVQNSLLALLSALRRTTVPRNRDVFWYEPMGISWTDRLRLGIEDHPGHHTHGWAQKLSDKPDVARTFSAAKERIESLLTECPERRDLLHSDLLHQNVLINDDGSAVTAVFSWKCSMLGDFLYDVAWCTFWAPWFEVLQGNRFFDETLAAEGLSAADLENASARHHCYELQIALSHFGWYLHIEDDENLERAALEAQALLERGPLPH